MEVPILLSLGKMGGLQDGKCPTNLLLRVLMDSGFMIAVIFVMASFGVTSILYTLFLDNFDDILAYTLLEREDS